MTDAPEMTEACALFDNLPEGGCDREFTLWYRPSHGRAGWEPVASHPTEHECVAAIGAGGRRGGKWTVLPAGQEP